jgi:hypothetical protein
MHTAALLPLLFFLSISLLPPLIFPSISLFYLLFLLPIQRRFRFRQNGGFVVGFVRLNTNGFLASFLSVYLSSSLLLLQISRLKNMLFFWLLLSLLVPTKWRLRSRLPTECITYICSRSLLSFYLCLLLALSSHETVSLNGRSGGVFPSNAFDFSAAPLFCRF